MSSQSSQQQQIPTLDSIATLATFGAFKVDEKLSFVRPYDPKVQAIPGFRHAIVRYRNTDKAGTVDKPAKMATVPELKLTDDYLVPEKAANVLLGVFEDEQDNIVRGFVDSGASHITWDSVTLDKVLDSLTAVRLSNRLTKEQIENWSKIALVDSCTVRATQIAVEKKYNAEQTAKQVAGTINAYVALAMKMAAPVPNIGQGEATALNNMLLVSKLDDDMAKVLLAKLNAILHPKITENGDL